MRPAGVAVVVVLVGLVGLYELMIRDIHILLLALHSAICGAGAGLVVRGRRGFLGGAVLGFGFVLPVAYLPLWFAFDLPPRIGIDL